VAWAGFSNDVKRQDNVQNRLVNCRKRASNLVKVITAPLLPSLGSDINITRHLNPLESSRNYSAASNNMKLVHWPLMGGLIHLVQRGADWAWPQPAQAPLRYKIIACIVCNI